MSDDVARAREALEDLDAADWSWFKTRSRCWPVGDDTHAVMNWCQLARQLVPELVDALEQARMELEHLRGLQRDDRDTALAAPEASALNDRWAGFCRLSPDKARSFAAALLAAANAADRSHHPDCSQEKP